jgi:Beta-lactamase superfamily domain
MALESKTLTSPSTIAGSKVSERGVGVNDPGIPFADLPPIDVVLVSHGHYDHLYVRTLSRIAATDRAGVITPLGAFSTPLSLPRKITFPGNRDRQWQRLVRMSLGGIEAGTLWCG